MDIMTVSQAALFLQVSDDVIYPLLAKGAIPAARVKGQWRIIKEDLIVWMRSQYAVIPAITKEQKCRISALEQQTGGSLSREYDRLLGRQTTKTRKRLKPS